MNRKFKKIVAKRHILICLPLLALFILSVPACNKTNNVKESGSEVATPQPSQTKTAKTDLPEPYDVADQMPVFKDGEEALIEYVAKNTNYPDAAKEKGIQGRVIVRFAVEADGSVDRISVLKSADPDLDKEAVRVVSEIPAFEKPGIKDGKSVAVWYALPINFALK